MGHVCLAIHDVVRADGGDSAQAAEPRRVGCIGIRVCVAVASAAPIRLSAADYPKYPGGLQKRGATDMLPNNFKELAMRGNVLDLAVAVVIGAVFGATAVAPAIAYGCFLKVIDFLIAATVICIAVRHAGLAGDGHAMNRARSAMRILPFTVLVSLLMSTAWADQVVMKNGDRVTGTIVKQDGKTITIRTNNFGVVTAPGSRLSHSNRISRSMWFSRTARPWWAR
jgi:hypothetical protein